MNSDKEKNKTRGDITKKYVSGSNAIHQKLALNQKKAKISKKNDRTFLDKIQSVVKKFNVYLRLRTDFRMTSSGWIAMRCFRDYRLSLLAMRSNKRLTALRT